MAARYSFCLVLLSVLCFCLPSNTGATEPTGRPEHIVTLSAWQGVPTGPVARAILDNAYGKLGIKPRYRHSPAKRALVEANAGKTDGDIARLPIIENRAANLVRVKVALDRLVLRAFTINSTSAITDWEDLTGHSVAVLRGVLLLETNTQKSTRVFAKDMKELMNFLVKRYVDFAIARDFNGQFAARKHFPGSKIRMTGKPLLDAPIYHYLHRRHQHSILPKLEEILRQMEKTGELAAIRRDTLRGIMQKTLTADN